MRGRSPAQKNKTFTLWTRKWDFPVIPSFILRSWQFSTNLIAQRARALRASCPDAKCNPPATERQRPVPSISPYPIFSDSLGPSQPHTPFRSIPTPHRSPSPPHHAPPPVCSETKNVNRFGPMSLWSLSPLAPEKPNRSSSCAARTPLGPNDARLPTTPIHSATSESSLARLRVHIS